MQLNVYLPDEKATKTFAKKFADFLLPPLTIGFQGEIGAGKTTFIRAMLKAIGVKGSIKSPTYALTETYLIKDLHVHHFDLYRIRDEDELEYIGFRDYFSDESICCIEWPENIGKNYKYIDLLLTLTMKGKGRDLTIKTLTDIGQKFIVKLDKK